MSNVINLFPSSKRIISSVQSPQIQPLHPNTDVEVTELFDQVIDNPFANKVAEHTYNKRLVDIFNIINNVFTWDFDKFKNEYYLEHGVYGFSTIRIEHDMFIFDDEHCTVHLRTNDFDVLTNLLK
ncbi:MAG: hypothetical protein ACRC3J_05030 [Culicoidibacterales bacterium]